MYFPHGKFDWNNITFHPKNNIGILIVDSANPDTVTVCEESVFSSLGSIKIMDPGFGERGKNHIYIIYIYIHVPICNIKHVFDFRW